MPAPGGLERELAAYYDRDAPMRASRRLDPQRDRWRDEFAELLAGERRHSVLEVGVGPGRDAAALSAAGFAVTGVDLSGEHVRIARDAGVHAIRASALHLPFGDQSFDGAWTMSTLVHVPNAVFDLAMSELARVLRPGSPVGVGLWGGDVSEGPNDFDTMSPPRFFSIRTDDLIRTMLEPHGDIERFVTHDFGDDHSWHYQWLILRTRM